MAEEERSPGSAVGAAGSSASGAVWRVREALRAWRRAHPDVPGSGVCVGLSGGADSLALTAAAVAEFGPELGAGSVRALVVDHGLQTGSADIARSAAAAARSLGAEALVLTADVRGPGGPEAAARAARYSALDAARGDRPVLLAHTLDDQAETVLLGLARGSGARSLRGMSPWAAPWGRPLLGIRRADTRAACAGAGVVAWDDPHNLDPRFRRVRVRSELLPLAEDVLGPGFAEALARTAGLLGEDEDALSALATDLLESARVPEVGGRESGGTEDGARDEPLEPREPGAPGGTALAVDPLAAAPAAVRGRAIKAWLEAEGAGAPTSAHIGAVSALVTSWNGQGAVAVPAGAGGGDIRRHPEGGGGGVAGGARPGSRAVRRLVVQREGRVLRLRIRQ